VRQGSTYIKAMISYFMTCRQEGGSFNNGRPNCEKELHHNSIGEGIQGKYSEQGGGGGIFSLPDPMTGKTAHDRE